MEEKSERSLTGATMEEETSHRFSGSTAVANSRRKRAFVFDDHKKKKIEGGEECDCLSCSGFRRYHPHSFSESVSKAVIERKREVRSMICLVVTGEGHLEEKKLVWNVIGDLADFGTKEKREIPLPHLPTGFKVAGSGYFGYASSIYVLGGFNWPPLYGKYRKDVLYCDVIASDNKRRWKRLPSFCRPRAFSLIVTTGCGTMYAFGSKFDDFGEVLQPDSYKWKTLPPLPSELSGIARVSMHAVFDRDRMILLYSFNCHTAFTYDVRYESWELIDSNFGFWWGDAAVLDDVMYCYGGFDDFTMFGVHAYDLLNLKWFPHPVTGLEGEGVLPPIPSGGDTNYFSFAQIVRMDGNRFCLIWAETTLNLCRQQEIHCTKFTIQKYFCEDTHDILFHATDLSHADYVVDGSGILSCLLMERISQEEVDTGKEKNKKMKNGGQKGKDSVVSPKVDIHTNAI